MRIAFAVIKFFSFLFFRYCLQHARKAALLRQRSTRKRRPKETPETLLEELDHYATSECETGVRKYRHNNENLSRIIGVSFNHACSLAHLLKIYISYLIFRCSKIC